MWKLSFPRLGTISWLPVDDLLKLFSAAVSLIVFLRLSSRCLCRRSCSSCQRAPAGGASRCWATFIDTVLLRFGRDLKESQILEFLCLPGECAHSHLTVDGSDMIGCCLLSTICGYISVASDVCCTQNGWWLNTWSENSRCRLLIKGETTVTHNAAVLWRWSHCGLIPSRCRTEGDC